MQLWRYDLCSFDDFQKHAHVDCTRVCVHVCDACMFDMAECACMYVCSLKKLFRWFPESCPRWLHTCICVIFRMYLCFTWPKWVCLAYVHIHIYKHRHTTHQHTNKALDSSHMKTVSWCTYITQLYICMYAHTHTHTHTCIANIYTFSNTPIAHAAPSEHQSIQKNQVLSQLVVILLCICTTLIVLTLS
jgi:hypothetical protein